jgi:phytoene desaturase
MMKFLLDEVFEATGRKSSDYMEFLRLDPMYELRFADRSVFPRAHPEDMKAEVARAFPGQGEGFDRFMEKEHRRFGKMYGCLQRDYSTFGSLFNEHLMSALPHLALGSSLYDVLARYFEPEDLRLSFTFQSKYLGMSPWICPGAFAIIPYIEYAYGIWHVMGGLSRISHGMAKVVEEEGGTLRFGATVQRVVVEGGQAKGVILEDGTRLDADEVVLNADFGHAMTTLFEPGVLRKFTKQGLGEREFSCSTFMLYLGVDRTWDTQVHTICFARDYHRNLEEIAVRKVLSDDPSFYVRNATVVDPGLAPPGHSALYVLVPVPNNTSGIDWDREQGAFRDRVIDAIEARSPFSGLREHIRCEQMITPADWEGTRHVYRGATFNLAHNLGQMLYFRPRNRFEEVGHAWLVGGGTHPGSGLPTIYQSGLISADLICRDHGVPTQTPRTFAVIEALLRQT